MSLMESSITRRLLPPVLTSPGATNKDFKIASTPLYNHTPTTPNYVANVAISPVSNPSNQDSTFDVLKRLATINPTVYRDFMKNCAENSNTSDPYYNNVALDNSMSPSPPYKFKSNLPERNNGPNTKETEASTQSKLAQRSKSWREGKTTRELPIQVGKIKFREPIINYSPNQTQHSILKHSNLVDVDGYREAVLNNNQGTGALRKTTLDEILEPGNKENFVEDDTFEYFKNYGRRSVSEIRGCNPIQASTPTRTYTSTSNPFNRSLRNSVNRDYLLHPSTPLLRRTSLSPSYQYANRSSSKRTASISNPIKMTKKFSDPAIYDSFSMSTGHIKNSEKYKTSNLNKNEPSRGDVDVELEVNLPPIVRVRNFSLTPQGNVINRGDSFRLRKSSVTMKTFNSGPDRKRAESLTPSNMRRNLASNNYNNNFIIKNNLPTHSMCENKNEKAITNAETMLNPMDYYDHQAAISYKADDRTKLIDQQINDTELSPSKNLRSHGRQSSTYHLDADTDACLLNVKNYEFSNEEFVGDESTEMEDMDVTSSYDVFLIGVDNVGKSSILAQFMSSEYINPYDYSDLDDEVFGSQLTDQEPSNNKLNSNQDNQQFKLEQHYPHAKYPLEDIKENRILELDNVVEDKESKMINLHDNHGNTAYNVPFLKEKSISITLDNESSILNFIEWTLKDDETFEDYFRMFANNDNKEPDGYVLVYSVNDRKTFENVIDVLYALKNNLAFPKARILVGNKCDLVRAKEISTEEGVSIAKTYRCKFIETSVAININLDNLLVGILTQIRLKNNLAEAIKNELSSNEIDESGMTATMRDCYSRMSDVMMEDIMGTNNSDALNEYESPKSLNIPSRGRGKLRKRLKAIRDGNYQDRLGEYKNTRPKNYAKSAQLIPSLPPLNVEEQDLENQFRLRSFSFKDLPPGIETDLASTNLFKKKKSIFEDGKTRANKFIDKVVRAAKRHSITS